MVYRFSAHVKQRLIERHISEDSLFQLLNGQVDTVIANSKTDPAIQLIYGVVEGKDLVVIVNQETHVIVTARRMQKRELRYFNERGEV
jgi:hypothetical protein